jgi:hypothetical protein
MGERTLKKRKPANMPCCILRPAIINASIKEPMPGWTDTLSAAGGLSVAGGSGVLKYVYAKEDNIADLIPVDYVCNGIIASTALLANKPALNVVHSNSSNSNPITWSGFMNIGYRYLTKQPLSTQAFKPKAVFSDNKKYIDTMFFLTSKLPTSILDKVSKIPGIGNPKMQKDVQTLKFVNDKLGDLYELFSHFTRNEWIYESKKIYELEAQMTPEERQIFYVDPKTFDWGTATCLYAKGVEHYMNKQDIYEVDDRTSFLLNKNKFRRFDSLRRTFIENQIIAQDPMILRKEAFASSFVQSQIEKELAKPTTETTKTYT